jgi:hypothetical protein
MQCWLAIRFRNKLNVFSYCYKIKNCVITVANVAPKAIISNQYTVADFHVFVIAPIAAIRPATPNGTYIIFQQTTRHQIIEQAAATIAATLCTVPSSLFALKAGAAPTNAIAAQVKNTRGFRYEDQDDITSPSSSQAGSSVKAIVSIIPVNRNPKFFLTPFSK